MKKSKCFCFLYKFHIDAHGEGGGSKINQSAEIGDVRRGEVMHLSVSQVHKKYFKSPPSPKPPVSLAFLLEM